MKLPLKIHFDFHGRDQVIDAAHRIVFDSVVGSERKFMFALVRKMNRSWRWRFFGEQPFVYTRNDWLYGKSPKVKA